jgi:hypothetical protein
VQRTLIAVISAWLFAGAPARADDAPCGSQRAWVALTSSALPREFVHKIQTDLGAGLAANQIDVCEQDGSPHDNGSRSQPIATVVLTPSPADPGLFSIDVTDSVTHKRIGRDVDVGKVPADGRSFALAVAADELLRASWAELTIDRQNHAAAPPPERKSSEVSVPDGRRVSPPQVGSIGARFAFERYAGEATLLGADAVWASTIGSYFELEAAFGARTMLPIESEEGSIRGSAVLAQLGGGPLLARTSWLRLAALLVLVGSRISYSPRASADAIGTDATGYALYARGGLDLSLGVRGFPLYARTSAGAGAPLRSFAAADSNGIVDGVKGLEIFGTTGVALEF